MRNPLIAFVLVAIIAGIGYWALNRVPAPVDAPEFSPVGELATDGSADVLRVTNGGNLLLHTNVARHAIDVIDISDPAQPALIDRTILPGIPTGIAISRDDQWALATLDFSLHGSEPVATHPRTPGGLAIIKLAKPAMPELTEIIGIGHQPSSVVVASSGADLVAVVAIENRAQMVAPDQDSGNETSVEEQNGTPKLIDISLPGNVQVVTFNPNRQSNYRVGSVDLSPARLTEATLRKPDDPQPSFVTLSPDQSLAAATLGENHGIEIFDPYWLETRRLFSTDDHRPSAAAFTSDGKVLFSVGVASTDQNSIAAWSPEGEAIWNDMGGLRRAAIKSGFISADPDSDTASPITAIAIDKFGATDFAFMLSADGAFIAVYDVSAPVLPKLVQLIGTLEPPTSIAPIGRRSLVTMADNAGNIRIYRHSGTPVTQIN